jgi:hypothetical protein
MQRMTKRRLGEVLLQERLVTKEQIEEALADQSVTGELLGEILVRKGYVAERNIAETIATQYSFPYLEPDQYYISGDIIHLLPMEIIEKHTVVPLDRFGDILTVVVAGPLDEEVVKEIEQKTGAGGIWGQIAGDYLSQTAFPCGKNWEPSPHAISLIGSWWTTSMPLGDAKKAGKA